MFTNLANELGHHPPSGVSALLAGRSWMVPGRLEILLTPAALRGQHLDPWQTVVGTPGRCRKVWLFEKDSFVDWLVVAANPSEMANVWLLYG